MVVNLSRFQENCSVAWQLPGLDVIAQQGYSAIINMVKEKIRPPLKLMAFIEV